MKILVLPLLCLSLLSCTSIKAHADYEKGLDFSTYQTFAMAAPPANAPAGMPGYSEITGREINEELARQLEAKGYVQSDEASADLIVSFDLAGELREDIRSTGGGPSSSYYRGWYGASWYDQTVYTVSYVQGTLIVDAFDREAERIIWHGWSSVALYSDADASKKGQKVIDAVMEKFPAR